MWLPECETVLPERCKAPLEAPRCLGKLACYSHAVICKSKTLATLTLPRERALEVCLRWLSLAAPPVWATLLAQAWRDDISFSFIFCLIGITSLLPILYVFRVRLGYVLTTRLCLLVLFLTTAYVETIVGFTPTSAVLIIFGILLATLLLGDKAFSTVLLGPVYERSSTPQRGTLGRSAQPLGMDTVRTCDGLLGWCGS